MRTTADRLLVAVAIGLGVATLALEIATLVFGYRTTAALGGEIDWGGMVWELWPLALVVVGVLVASARPRVFVGWGLLIAGFSIHVIAFGGTYGGWARLSGSSAPLVGMATWAGLAASGLFSMMAPLVVSRLPTGYPETRAARAVSRAAWALGTALVVWWGFGGEELSVNTMSGESLDQPPLSSPIRLVHLGRAVTSTVTTTLTMGVLACFLAAVVLVVRRRRHASSLERVQLRWLAGGLLVLPIGAVAQVLMVPVLKVLLDESVLEAVNDVSYTLLLTVGLAAIPVSIAISVLKFRLFEIDRLLSRTMVFAVVAVVLGSVYALLAVLPFTLVAGLDGGNTPSWVVAASTLAAAALFSPLRRRVQRVVDRRFNRSRYDAERVVERFASQVRQFTDVATITSGLTVAVGGALQPSRVAVWLRAAGS